MGERGQDWGGSSSEGGKAERDWTAAEKDPMIDIPEDVQKAALSIAKRLDSQNKDLTPRQAENYYPGAKYLLENEDGELWRKYGITPADKQFIEDIVDQVEGREPAEV